MYLVHHHVAPSTNARERLLNLLVSKILTQEYSNDFEQLYMASSWTTGHKELHAFSSIGGALVHDDDNFLLSCLF